MMMLASYVRRWHRSVRRILRDPELRRPLGMAGCFLLGLVLSAGSLKQIPLPLPLGLLCAGLSGWMPVPFAMGGALGYWLFWGPAGAQGMFWMAAGLPVCVLLGEKKAGLVQPALGALIVAATGLAFRLRLGWEMDIGLYLLQIAMAFGSGWLFRFVRERRNTAADWLAIGVGVLALAQIAPFGFLDLGIVAAAMLVTASPFPAVALSGLALDLAAVTPVPMTAVLSLGYLARLLPGKRPGLLYLAPAAAFVPVMALCGAWDPVPLPALLLGGFAGALLPRQTALAHRRGETGFAQVRLEMGARVLQQTEQLLADAQPYPIDEGALVEKAADRACGCCPCRRSCKYISQARGIPGAVLHRPLTGVEDLPVPCKKRGRLLLELRRSQDQYRILKADRDRQQEYRGAVLQQYRFLGAFLQDLADSLPRRGKGGLANFQPEIAIRSAARELESGDRCLRFSGTQWRYYVLLCDGMGTGAGAAEEARQACQLLKKLLMAGFPAAYALRSLNSLCTLRGRAGAATVDLAELQLQTGHVTLYKWGAAPSYVLVPTGPEKIGSAGAPPGLSALDSRESVDRVSLRRGEVLVMRSDGLAAEKAMEAIQGLPTESVGSLAGRILELGKGDGSDDATVAVIRLIPA